MHAVTMKAGKLALAELPIYQEYVDGPSIFCDQAIYSAHMLPLLCTYILLRGSMYTFGLLLLAYFSCLESFLSITARMLPLSFKLGSFFVKFLSVVRIFSCFFILRYCVEVFHHTVVMSGNSLFFSAAFQIESFSILLFLFT